MIEQKNNSGVVSDHELAEVRRLVEQRSGVMFDASRERFLSTRVRDFLAGKRLANGSDLLRLVRNSNAEYDAFLQSLLTQETSFFRYPDVFAAFQKQVLPQMHVKKFWESPRNLRIWSAGCSTGEEPYSIAISIADTMEFVETWSVNILATDISRQALEHAERGVYSPRDVEGLTPAQLESYFVRVGGHHMVKPRIRNMINFAPMNLAQPVYMGRFDCIFCMNVLIYFSPERRAALIQRFTEYLEPGGYLFLGHAESIANAGVKLEPIVYRDSLFYQKPGEPRCSGREMMA